MICPRCGIEMDPPFDTEEEGSFMYHCSKCMELVEVPQKEELIVDVDDSKPYLHAGRFESYFYDEHFQHNIMTEFPWSKGKVKITIERLKRVSR